MEKFHNTVKKVDRFLSSKYMYFFHMFCFSLVSFWAGKHYIGLYPDNDFTPSHYNLYTNIACVILVCISIFFMFVVKRNKK